MNQSNFCVTKFIAIAVVLLTMSGCLGASTNKYVEKKQYLLQVELPKVSTKAKTSTKHSLLIDSVAAESPFGQSSFLYRVSENQYLVDYYSDFLSPPVTQLDSLLNKYLAATGKFNLVMRGEETEHSYKLHLRILELYADYRDRKQPEAVITVHVSLTKPSKTTRVKLFDKTFHATAPLATKSTDDLLTAWDECLADLFRSNFYEFGNKPWV